MCYSPYQIGLRLLSINHWPHSIPPLPLNTINFVLIYIYHLMVGKVAVFQGPILLANAPLPYNYIRNPFTLEPPHFLVPTSEQPLTMNDERNLTRLPVMHREHRSLFMELPTEVRENILRYLLVASYTSTEHNVRSKEVNHYSSGL